MWLCVNCIYYICDGWFGLFEDVGMKGYFYFDYFDVVCLEMLVLVYVLFGFVEGWVIVQDVFVQGCVVFFVFQNGEYILDLCVVFGGKIMYIFEVVFEVDVLVVDIDE